MAYARAVLIRLPSHLLEVRITSKHLLKFSRNKQLKIPRVSHCFHSGLYVFLQHRKLMVMFAEYTLLAVFAGEPQTWTYQTFNMLFDLRNASLLENLNSSIFIFKSSSLLPQATNVY